MSTVAYAMLLRRGDRLDDLVTALLCDPPDRVLLGLTDATMRAEVSTARAALAGGGVAVEVLDRVGQAAGEALNALVTAHDCDATVVAHGADVWPRHGFFGAVRTGLSRRPASLLTTFFAGPDGPELFALRRDSFERLGRFEPHDVRQGIVHEYVTRAAEAGQDLMVVPEELLAWPTAPERVRELNEDGVYSQLETKPVLDPTGRQASAREPVPPGPGGAPDLQRQHLPGVLMTEVTSTSADDLDAGKAAVARKDWNEARRILAPLVTQDPQGFATFLLARTELEAGRPDVAAPLLDAFQARLPRHAGARVLRARIHLARGDRTAARWAVRTALELDPEHRGAKRVLTQIAHADLAALTERHVAVVDAGHLPARTTGPTEEVLEAARALRDSALGPDWTNDPVQAKVAYFHHATDLGWALRNYDAHLVEVSARFDYITWPRRIQEFVRGRSVLDVGCGFGGFGMGFLIAGATEYVGLDPAMDLDSTRARNKRARQWQDMGSTPRQIAETLPAMRLYQDTAEQSTLDEKFDTISLHNVTEHLPELERVLDALVRSCRPDSTLVYLHHNFYCWNGHHLAPNLPDQLDEANPKHAEVYDWRHIELVPRLPEDHSFRTHLNRIRLDELRAVTERHFDVVTWDEIRSSPETLSRLTPEVTARVRRTVPDLTQRELTTKLVFCVAKPKAR